jgi:hypothetical protein
MRLAVRVVVRAPGRIVRRVRVRSLSVQRLRGSRLFAVRIANRGNVTETIGRGRLTVTLLVRGREAVRLAAGAREVLPGADAIVRLRYSGRLRGPVVARVAVVGGPTRTFRARL